MTQLETRKLGQSDLMITSVGVGTAPMGSTPGWRINWGSQSEADTLKAIETALDLGINWIDTAPFYGWGRAEQLVGKVLKGKREKVYLFTKCGTIRDEQGQESENLTPANIRREIEVSLRNLQTDYIDLYQFHDPDLTTPIEESWMAVQQLIQEGKVALRRLIESHHPIYAAYAGYCSHYVQSAPASPGYRARCAILFTAAYHWHPVLVTSGKRVFNGWV